MTLENDGGVSCTLSVAQSSSWLVFTRAEMLNVQVLYKCSPPKQHYTSDIQNRILWALSQQWRPVTETIVCFHFSCPCGILFSSQKQCLSILKWSICVMSPSVPHALFFFSWLCSLWTTQQKSQNSAATLPELLHKLHEYFNPVQFRC